MRDLSRGPSTTCRYNGRYLCRDYSRSTSQARTLNQLNDCIALTYTYRTLHPFIRRSGTVGEVSTGGIASCPARLVADASGKTHLEEAKSDFGQSDD